MNLNEAHINIKRVIEYIKNKLAQQPDNTNEIELRLTDFGRGKNFELQGLENFGTITTMGIVGIDNANNILLGIVTKLRDDYNLISGFSLLEKTILDRP